MVRVRVRIFGTLRLDLGLGEVELELPGEVPLREVLERLARVLGEKRGKVLREKLFEGQALRPGVIILKDGVNVLHLEGLSTPVRGGESLSVFPPGGGG
ncbi:MoaD/ThiS family protein [Thermosulfurimonas dismutans]|uniref:MoaD family protein n=1 Tax=Thermosulfurimonas dismutans TaxID=999894 RepID=A0A179D400_9BACT|nr:MoaD/ThiS family protein [Thermosulfurimonas dismutans]OAQ20800.1 moaD family protein [Thermosulfurimonas dismutans]